MKRISFIKRLLTILVAPKVLTEVKMLKDAGNESEIVIRTYKGKDEWEWARSYPFRITYKDEIK